jgi:hypothetical protein
MAVRLSLNGCRNIDDVLKLVIKHRDNLPPNQVAAAWSFMSRLLLKEQRHYNGPRRGTRDDEIAPEQREQQLQLFLQCTLSSLDKLRSKDLTTIVLSMAKSVKSIREAHERKRMSTYHQALGSLFQKSKPFGHFAKAADRLLMETSEFNARCMSNLAYAYALVGYNPKFEDGSSLLEKIGDRSIACIKKFTSQELANLVWAKYGLGGDKRLCTERGTAQRACGGFHHGDLGHAGRWGATQKDSFWRATATRLPQQLSSATTSNNTTSTTTSTTADRGYDDGYDDG